jgi:phosphoglycerate dehydrogenase-like enzyme
VKLVVGFRADNVRLDQLRAAYPSLEIVAATTNEAIVREIADADAFYGIPTREQYLAGKRLRWVQAPIAGIEFVHGIPELAEDDVVLTNARGAHGTTVAEHLFAILLSLTRRLRFFDHARGFHAWLQAEGYQNAVGIGGKTMGIVGYGSIGRAIGKRADAFDMRVLAVDAQPVPADAHVVEVWGLERLPDLLGEADVLSIAAPLTPQTRGMIGETEIRLLKRGSYLMGISRGGIVDEPALIRALEDGHLAGAGLDVAATEPLPPGDPLWDAPNLVITPHCSNASALTTELTWSIFADNVGRFVRGEPLHNVTDKRRGY